jgi:hypothetical protein
MVNFGYMIDDTSAMTIQFLLSLFYERGYTCFCILYEMSTNCCLGNTYLLWALKELFQAEIGVPHFRFHVGWGSVFFTEFFTEEEGNDLWCLR